MRLLGEVRNYMGNYHVKSGVYHFYRNEFTQAVGFLRKALADEVGLSAGDAKNARCYLTLSLKGLSEKLAASGEIEAAIEELRHAAEVSPTWPDIHFSIARLLERLERHAEAVRSYRKAIAGNPAYLDAYVAMGHCLLVVGRTRAAIAAFRRAFAVKLERLRAPFRDGLGLLERGDTQEALNRLHEVFYSAAPVCEEHLRKALEWMRAEEHAKALGEIDRALQISPHYPDLHNYRGIVLCEIERYDESLEAFRTSAELSPEHLVPKLNLAFAQLRAGRTRDAEIELESILDRDPTDTVAGARLNELRAARVPDKRGTGGARA
jgi:tetratricopeptide (TPR) repeat protein